MESAGPGPARPRFAVPGLAESLSPSSPAAAAVQGVRAGSGAPELPRSRMLLGPKASVGDSRAPRGPVSPWFLLGFVGAAQCCSLPWAWGPWAAGGPRPCPGSPAARGMHEVPLLPALKEGKGHGDLGVLQPHQPHCSLRCGGKEPGRGVPAAPGPGSARVGPWGRGAQVTAPAGLSAASAMAKAGLHGDGQPWSCAAALSERHEPGEGASATFLHGDIGLFRGHHRLPGDKEGPAGDERPAAGEIQVRRLYLGTCGVPPASSSPGFPRQPFCSCRGEREWLACHPSPPSRRCPLPRC